MATASSKRRRPRHEAETHVFTLVLGGVRDLSEDLENAVFEAGCDDAVLGLRSGVAFLEFDREAASLPEAVLSAIEDVESVPHVDVVRVEPDDLVTASEIARRTGRSRESVRQLAGGLRGPGAFPPPLHNVCGTSPLWRWADVAEWFGTTLGDAKIDRREWEAAAFIAMLNSALQMHDLVPTKSVVAALWSRMNRWRERSTTYRFGWLDLVRDSDSR